MQSELKFGDFVKWKRELAGMSLREMARRIGVKSSGNYSEIERNIVSSPGSDVLKKIVQVLDLNKEDEKLMYELADKCKKGKERKTIPYDLVEFIADNKHIKNVLRVMQDLNATEKESMEIIKKLTEERNEERKFIR